MSISIPFHNTYSMLLQWLLSDSCPTEQNARTGRAIKAGVGGTAFRVNLADRVLPTPGLRRTYPKSAAAEVAWFLSGETDVTWMRKHAPFWDKFVGADGKTVISAYGYRWRHHFDRDQLLLGLQALRKDPSDRRVFISAWDPSTDGLGAEGQKNVPCPLGFTLSISGGQLHSAIFLRSSDVFVGLPYDVMGHALLMDALAAELNVTPGIMHGTLAHPHLYEDHWDMAREALQQVPVVPNIRMPAIAMHNIIASRDTYVGFVAHQAQQAEWPSFAPKPFVVE
jgi:thymidylate synthase